MIAPRIKVMDWCHAFPGLERKVAGKIRNHILEASLKPAHAVSSVCSILTLMVPPSADSSRPSLSSDPTLSSPTAMCPSAPLRLNSRVSPLQRYSTSVLAGQRLAQRLGLARRDGAGRGNARRSTVIRDMPSTHSCCDLVWPTRLYQLHPGASDKGRQGGVRMAADLDSR